MTALEQEIEEIKERFGELLMDEEIAVLLRTKEILNVVIELGLGFDVSLKKIEAKLRDMLVTHYDPETSLNHPHTYYDQPMSEISMELSMEKISISKEEERFLKDALGAIDFVIRNGVGFPLIALALGHDINGIFNHGGLKQALAAAFSPKVREWAGINEDSFGDPEEDMA